MKSRFSRRSSIRAMRNHPPGHKNHPCVKRPNATGGPLRGWGGGGCPYRSSRHARSPCIASRKALCALWSACHHPGEACTPWACFCHLERASARVIVPFHLLCTRCMRWVFLRSYGEPPRERGMSSSTSPRMGWGTHPAHSPPGHFLPCSPGLIVRVLSTGRSQRAHTCSSDQTRLTSCRRLCPLALCSGVAMVTSQWTTQDSPVTALVRGYLCGAWSSSRMRVGRRRGSCWVSSL